MATHRPRGGGWSNRPVLHWLESDVQLSAERGEESEAMSDYRQEQKPLWVETLEGMLLICIMEATLATVTALIVSAYRV